MIAKQEPQMNEQIRDVLSRRRVVARLGAGGLGAALAARGLVASAQAATPHPIVGA